MGRSGIVVYDRLTKKYFEEKVYGGQVLRFLYGKNLLSRFFGRPLVKLLASFPLFSRLYGWRQRTSRSQSKVMPFIREYSIDESEFLEPAHSFSSFNEFFIRKLKQSSRPIANSDFIIPADGRYLFYQDISKADGFYVKGKKFDLAEFLQSSALADRYRNGSMAIGRLCPTDYHRFHFPMDCVPSPPELINGYLYSVNPIALKKNIHIFSQNKRSLTKLQNPHFGEALFIEVGATNVGSIVETYSPGKNYAKGEEKGYFEFGGSSLVILFPSGVIQFDKDLLEISSQKQETLCLMGQSMGNRVS